MNTPLLASSRDRARLAFLGLIYLVVHYVLGPIAGPRVTEHGSQVAIFFSGRGSRLFKTFCWNATTGTFEDSDLVEVIEGLRLTDKVIAGGREGLRDGKRITITGEDSTLGIGAGPAATESRRSPRLAVPGAGLQRHH